MKKFILFVAIAASLVACSNHKTTEQAGSAQAISTTDTSGLAEFKEWKEKQEQIPTQTFSSEGIKDTEVATEEKPAPVVIYKEVPARQPRAARASKPVSRKVYRQTAPEPENSGIAKTPAPENTGTKREAYGRGTTGTEGTAGSGTETSNEGDVAVSQPAEVPAKKEGWSKAAKGTAVGGASGAVIGAVISKNKTKGAVIGGIVGAAGGYIFGRKQDKKDGRY